MKHLVSKLALISIIVTAIPVCAGEEEDREAIRALFHKEQEGHRIGNAQMVRSTYWDDFHLIDIPRPDGRPHYLLSKIISRNEYFAGQGLNEDDYQGRKAWGDRLVWHSEVNHISVNGDIALATTKFNYLFPASGGGRNNNGHTSLWVAEKRNDVWKWKSAQIVDSFREFIAPLPRPNPEDAQ